MTEEDLISSSDNEYIYSIGTEKSKFPTIKVTVNGVEIKMLLDTGSSTDILEKVAFQ